MTASMTIRLTEDDDPDGCVSIEFDYEGFELEEDTEDADLPPALLLGAKMVELSRGLDGPDDDIRTLRLMHQAH